MRNLFQKYTVFVQAIAQLALDPLQSLPAEVGTDAGMHDPDQYIRGDGLLLGQWPISFTVEPMHDIDGGSGDGKNQPRYIPGYRLRGSR